MVSQTEINSSSISYEGQINDSDGQNTTESDVSNVTTPLQTRNYCPTPHPRKAPLVLSGVALAEKCKSPVYELSNKTVSTPEDHEMCRIASADLHTDASGKSFLCLPNLDSNGHS